MKWPKINRRSIGSAIRTFTASVGATAVCMVSSLAFLGSTQPVSAMEASVFNGGSGFREETAAPVSETGGGTKYVIPLGTTFGIKLFTDGVIVASLSDIYTENGVSCPAADAGIRPGDYILSVNGKTVENNEFLARLVCACEGKSLSLQVKRGEEIFETTVQPIYGEGSFKTGMWIRDSAAGIGTLTFYNPESKVFAGLGHGICDMDTSGIMTLKSGEPAEITLCGIVKGKENEPGRLKGYFSSDEAMGQLLVNNETGVYGTFRQEPTGEAMEVMKRGDVKRGKVQLLVSTDQSGPQLYDAEIQKVSADSQHTKNLVVKVTDPRLLAQTGGIVQGMSGCPIIQDGKLAGAITHVFTEDPTTGYGIFAETMCEESVVFSMSK